MLPKPDISIHREAGESDRPRTSVEIGGHGPPSEFMCGCFGAGPQAANPLFDALPELIVVSPSSERWATLEQLIEIATRQQRDRTSGGRAVVSRLAETVFVSALHQHVLTLPDAATGWLAGLRDAHVGATLAAIHRDPARPWNLDMLARRGGSHAGGRIRGLSTRVLLPPRVQASPREHAGRVAVGSITRRGRSIGTEAMDGAGSRDPASSTQGGGAAGRWLRISKSRVNDE